MTRRSLDRRIGSLEALRARRKTVEPLLMLVESAESERELLPSERVVIDRFRDIESIVWVRRRITSDPAEVGQHCEPGGYLVDMLAQFHDRCHWRNITGACRMCQGTPAAGAGCDPATQKQEVDG
jgi:hypothetical protein